jgi:hypothetical protein
MNPNSFEQHHAQLQRVATDQEQAGDSAEIKHYIQSNTSMAYPIQELQQKEIIYQNVMIQN